MKIELKSKLSVINDNSEEMTFELGNKVVLMERFDDKFCREISGEILSFSDEYMTIFSEDDDDRIDIYFDDIRDIGLIEE